MPDQFEQYYKYLKANGADVAPDFNSFKNTLSNYDNASKYYSYLKENEFDVPETYDSFANTFGLKKKVGGEISSPTESKSPSREYLSEGQELVDKGFVKTDKLDPSQLVSQYKSPDISLSPKPKKDYYSLKLDKGLIFDKEGKLFAPSSEALTKDITAAEEINLKKSTQKDLVEKSREMPIEEEAVPIEKQGWLLNTVSALDKGFYKNFISNPIKGLGTFLQGSTKKVLGGTGEGFISDKLIQLGDYLNNTIDELTPQDEEFKGTLTDQVAQAFGQVGSVIVTGGIAGAGKGATAALVSEVPKGAVATATKAIGSQLSSPTAVSAGLSMGQAEFDRAKEAGANDDQAFEAFYKNAATGSVLETIPVMQFFKRFNNTTGGSVANYIKTKGVAGLTGGIEEMTTEVMQQIYSNKTAKDIYNINQDILDGVGTSGGIGFGVGFVLNAMGANAKILRKQGKQQEADVLENQVKQFEDNLENPKVTSDKKAVTKDIITQGVEIGTQKAVKSLDRDLANNVITPEQYEEGIVFTEKAAQVVDKIPETVTGESKVKSVELLVERNDIKQANQSLLEQKQTTDEAYHAGIDQEIKANEEKIKKLDAEVYNIAKSPSKEFGGKKYIVDGEEVSQAEFEALQGKPIGTKKVIKAEVKPEEVKLELQKELDRLDLKPLSFKTITNKDGSFSYQEIPDAEYKDLLDKREKRINEINVELKALEKITEEEPPIEQAKEVKPTEAIEKDNNGNFAPKKFTLNRAAPIEEQAPSISIKSIKEESFGGEMPTDVKQVKLLEVRGRNADGETVGTVLIQNSDGTSSTAEVKFNEKLASLEVKPTEVKKPTKELIEGEVVKFKTPQGNTLEGEKVEMEGYEDMDMILVKDGFENRIYELTSGIEIGNTGSAFAKQDAVSALRNQLLEKNISSEKIKNKLFKEKSLQINPSNKFESYSEQRTTKERADYESLPLKYNPDELKKLTELKKKAIDLGIDNRAKEIEEAIQSRAKEGTYKGTPEFFEKMLQKDIDRKIKKEAEDKKTPYPKEFIEKFPEVTEDYLKTMVNSGYKVDKYSKVPQDVKKVMIDGLQLNRDFKNKYGYQPNKESDEFFTKLLYFMNSVGARENKESRAITAKKELISAFDNLSKVHEEEFGKKAEAEVKPKEGEVKVYNAKDLKENPEILEEDKNYHTINYPKSFDILYTNKDALINKNLENKKIGDVINIFNKDYVIADYPLGLKNKVKLIRVDKEGNLLRMQDTKGKIEKINYKDIVNNPKIFQENRDEIVGNYYGMGSNKSSIPALNKIKREIKIGDKINWGGDYVVLEVKGDKNNPDVYLANIDKDGNLIRIEAEEIEIEETEQVTKDDLKKAEAKFAAAEDKFKKARNKIEATQVKQAGIFGGEQKGMFAMGGTEAKSALDPLRKEAKEAKAELDNVKNRIKVQEEAQAELAPIEPTKKTQEAVKAFTTKNGRQKVEYEKGQLIVRDAKTGKEVSPSTRKKALDEYVENFDFSKGKTVEELEIELPTNLNDEEGKIFIADNSSNPLELLVLYSNEPKEQKLSGKEQMIAELGISTVDQDSFNKEMDRNFKTGGIAFSYFRKGGSTLDDIASQMERHYGVEFTPEDIGNFIINHPRGSDAALREGESRPAQRAAERFKELTGLNLDNTLANKIIDAEMAKAEAFEQELIKQEYETREQLEAEYYKASAEADRLAEKGNRPPVKESEKTQEKELAKDYKEAIGKASKKAKENAKKDFVDRNFDNIVEKLKIQIKCPT